MSCCPRTALIASLSAHLVLSKSRLETLSTLIIGLLHGRSVNLTHIASHCRGPACYASKYRRLQRFFQYVRLDQAVIAALVIRMLKLARPKCLALDRTNWKIGRHDVNILMLAIVTRRFRVPLFWAVLRHQGNSNTAQRIALLKQYLALFEPGSIELLLADREFIGVEWFKFLIDAKIPFAIRVRSELVMSLPDGRLWSIDSLLRNKRARRTIHTLDLVLPDTPLTVQLAAKRLASGEWLIVMTNTAKPKRALQTYRRRWGIECLFGDAKTRGLNLEDTHLTDPAKIELLVVILTLAMTWIYKTATAMMGLRSIPRKAHGRRQKSWFRTGFDALRAALINAPQDAASWWARSCPKRLRASCVVYRGLAIAKLSRCLILPRVLRPTGGHLVGRCSSNQEVAIIVTVTRPGS